MRSWIEQRARDVDTVFYDGPDGFGVGESNALAAAAAGVPLISAPSLLPIDGLVDTVFKHLDFGSVVNPATPSRSQPVQGTSNWEIGFSEAAAGIASVEDFVWLLLVRSTDFASESVGLDLEPSLGWALIVATVGDVTYYYPAVDIRPAPLSGTRDVVVNYRVAESLPNIDGVLTFPQFQGGLAVSPIPEPTTLLLLSLGLFGLVAVGRRPCS
jgi:hypothetical protein